jgi:hypothetical protein
MQALGSRIRDTYERPGNSIPMAFITGPLQLATNWVWLARALGTPRNGAFRLVKGLLAFAAVIGAFAFSGGLRQVANAGGPSMRHHSCSIAIMLLEFLRNTLRIEASEAAAEVVAAAAPPQLLLPLLHGVAGQLLEALEAGAERTCAACCVIPTAEAREKHADSMHFSHALSCNQYA